MPTTNNQLLHGTPTLDGSQNNISILISALGLHGLTFWPGEIAGTTYGLDSTNTNESDGEDVLQSASYVFASFKLAGSRPITFVALIPWKADVWAPTAPNLLDCIPSTHPNTQDIQHALLVDNNLVGTGNAPIEVDSDGWAGAVKYCGTTRELKNADPIEPPFGHLIFPISFDAKSEDWWSKTQYAADKSPIVFVVYIWHLQDHHREVG